MWLHIASELSLPWDDSSDSFYSGSDSDTIAAIDNPQTAKPQLLPQPEELQINNPYHQQDPPPPCQTIFQTLQSWIIPQPQNPIPPPSNMTQTIPSTIEIVNPSQPTTSNTPQHYQTSLVTYTNNNHWGDPMLTHKLFNTFRVISRNVNTLSTQQDYLQWHAASQAISKSKANMIAFQETNLSWNKTCRRCIQQILQQPTGNAILATTNSTKISSNTYQRGGTIQAVIGSWTSHTISNRHDTKGLGHWSFIKIQGKDDQQFIFLLGCRVCDNQTVDFGLNNMYNQQFWLLHQQGEISPNPQTQFLDNIIHQIQSWQAQHKAILICIDMNDNPQQESTNGVTQIFQEMDLCNLHSVQHPHQVCPQHTTKAPNQSISVLAVQNSSTPCRWPGIYHLDYHRD